MHDAPVRPRPTSQRGPGGNRTFFQRWWVRGVAAATTFAAYGGIAAPAFAWPGCAC